MAEPKESTGSTTINCITETKSENQQHSHGKVDKVFSVALTNAVAKDNPSMTSKSMIRLFLIMVLVTMANCMNGYDGSVMSSLNAMDPFHEYFGISMEGSSIGLVTALYSVGNIIGCFLASPTSDLMGRRFGMSVGCAFIVVGTIVQATTATIGGFMGGRLLVGMGVTVVTTSAPVYLIEMAYPTWRGIGSGLFNVCGWYIGALTASWTTYGTGHLTTNWSWRIPVIIQGIPAVLAMFLVWLIPESPRWLMMVGRSDEAHHVLVKYHGNGCEDSAVVQLECAEINASVAHARSLASGQAWYDYRILVNSREVLYRMFLVLLVSVFSQFIGGSISYYMPVVYENLGITSSEKQLLLNALSTVVSFLFGLIGSSTVEGFGRRNLFLWGTFLTGLVYLVMNVLASQANGHISDSMGYAFIVMSFLYGAVWSFCWTPLQALYPTEVLRNDIRVKGMAAQGVLSGLAGFINMYATPVALNNIGWKTYTIFLVLHFLEWAIMYFTIVETKGRSLEELDEIFTDPHPVKKSLERKEVLVERGVGVLAKSEDC
ncbi:putative sugar transporter [Talaromyces proteolyticus]|uniref:Sugar transporter n=1 Tax=Talaromyces proteolyticus TaxID=1131652 RepID=A0AAD4PW55_9EURO|nr:putative sugar transporter [Talaromyces proteolyticus]KAH8691537.1 putative sugar transporter [Talaromyces proteolyticus]